eukprot:4706356-Prymnesium_polylepis.1
MGRTLPVSESSPVIARSARGGVAVASESSAVTIVTPADGPSLGVAPSGTCRCSGARSRYVLSGCSALR